MATKFTLVNESDGNDTVELDATDKEGALMEALTRLGWSLTRKRVKDKSNLCPTCGQDMKEHDPVDGECPELPDDLRPKIAAVKFKGGKVEEFRGTFWGDVLMEVSGAIENDFDPDAIQSIHIERPAD